MQRLRGELAKTFWFWFHIYVKRWRTRTISSTELWTSATRPLQKNSFQQVELLRFASNWTCSHQFVSTIRSSFHNHAPTFYFHQAKKSQNNHITYDRAHMNKIFQKNFVLHRLLVMNLWLKQVTLIQSVFASGTFLCGVWGGHVSKKLCFT